MRYIGRLAGTGVLRCDGQEIAPTTYDFDCFSAKPAGVTRSGEIRLAALALKNVFGRKGVQLLTDDGRLLDLRFSEKVLLAASEVAHVEVTGESPDIVQH